MNATLERLTVIKALSVQTHEALTIVLVFKDMKETVLLVLDIQVSFLTIFLLASFFF